MRGRAAGAAKLLDQSDHSDGDGCGLDGYRPGLDGQRLEAALDLPDLATGQTQAPHQMAACPFGRDRGQLGQPIDTGCWRVAEHDDGIRRGLVSPIELNERRFAKRSLRLC